MHTKIRIAIATNLVLASSIMLARSTDQEVKLYSNIGYSEKALDREVSTTTSLFELPVVKSVTTRPKTTTTLRKIPGGKVSSNNVKASDDIWWRLAMCETGGKNANTGNGFYGYFQFVLDTWKGVGGTGYPHHHAYEEQKHRAQILHSRSGWKPWPGCSRKLGLR